MPGICPAAQRSYVGNNNCFWQYASVGIVLVEGIYLLGHRSAPSFLYSLAFLDRRPDLFLLFLQLFPEYLFLIATHKFAFLMQLLEQFFCPCIKTAAVNTIFLGNLNWLRFTNQKFDHSFLFLLLSILYMIYAKFTS